MSLYYEWVDFISYPLDATKIQSREQRLDLTLGISTNSPEWSPGAGKPGIVTREMIIRDDSDEFEATLITDSGGVMIWTKRRVWTLRPQQSISFPDEYMERLEYVARHPYTTD